MQHGVSWQLTQKCCEFVMNIRSAANCNGSNFVLFVIQSSLPFENGTGSGILRLLLKLMQTLDYKVNPKQCMRPCIEISISTERKFIGRWVCIDFRQIKIHHPNVASLFCLLCLNIVVNFIFECSKLKREKTSDSLSLLFDSIQLHVQRIYFGSNEKIYHIDFPSKFKCSL